MSSLARSKFTKWDLEPIEHKSGSTYNLLQQMVIQNLICDAAEQKVALTFDPQNPIQFAQQEAELQGKIGILEYLLAQSEEVIQSQMNGE